MVNDRIAHLLVRSAALLAALGMAISGAVATSAHASGPLQQDHYQATIYRTAHDIPHIVAGDLGSLGFGYGYAFAQDNVCTLANDVVTLEADRSRFFGPAATEPDTGSDNLTSDFYYQWLIDQGTVDRLLQLPPPVGPTDAARTLVQGYADGYNRYLRDVGVANLPDPTCRGQAWVHPITGWDVWARMYQLALLESGGQLFPFMEAAQPPGAGARTVPQATSGAALQSLLRPSAGLGSNGVALGADATQTGSGMLLANPHLPWTGTNRLYQVQLTIPGQLDVAGASLYGMPIVAVGHNEHTAWTHTISIGPRYTFFQLQLVPHDPTTYLVDGQPVPMTHQVVSVGISAPGGGLEQQHLTFYGTRFGPAIALQPLGLNWTQNTAYAVEDANAGNLRLVDQWLAMSQAGGVEDIRASEARIQGLPWVNTIATDDRGRALYLDISSTPHVTDAQVTDCVNTPLAKALLAQPDGEEIFLLDGSRRACDWGSDPDAVQPGLYGPAREPQLLRTDFVENSNDSFWLTNPKAPLTGFPRIMGAVGTERGPRMRLELLEIEGRLSGTDGRAGNRYTLDQLLADGFDDRSYFGELTRDDVVAMCYRVPLVTMSDGSVVNVSPACPVLAAWDLHMNLNSRGAELYQEFLNQLQLFPGGGPWKHPFSPTDPIGTPNTLDTSSATVQQALGTAVRELEAAHVPLDDPLGAVQFEPAANGERIPIHGGLGEVSGVLNDIEPLLQSDGQVQQVEPDGLYSPILDGSSFVMATEFTDQGPSTKTILTYSESANPASPFSSDQTRLFSAKEWIQERFTRSEILADPALTTLSLAGPR